MYKLILKPDSFLVNAIQAIGSSPVSKIIDIIVFHVDLAFKFHDVVKVFMGVGQKVFKCGIISGTALIMSGNCRV